MKKFLAPALAWTIALATLAGAAHELRGQRNALDTAAVLAEMPRFGLRSSALTLADYQTIQEKMTVSGTIQVLPAQDALSVKAMAISDDAAWRLTIDQILLDNPGVNWRIDYLCSGKCPSGEAHKALLVGTRVSGSI